MLTALALTVATALAMPPPAALPQAQPQPACDSGHVQAMAFPLTTRIPHPSIDAHCFVPGPAERSAVESLRNYRCVRLGNLQLPGANTVDLQMTRIDDVEPRFISLDGATVGAPGSPRPTDMSLWSGNLVGVTGSRACIAFSAVGIWGWIRSQDHLYHLASFPAAGRWDDFRVLLIDDLDRNSLNGSRCGDLIPEPPTRSPDFNTCLTGLAAPSFQYECPDPGIDHLRLCRSAIETDWQFYSRFGDVRAAEVYARFVFGAVAQALRLDVRVVCELDYLGFWTTPADPWTQPDLTTGQTAGPCCVDVFYEFQHRWGTQDLITAGPRFNLGPGLDLAPVDADLYHLMSGTQMGCAVGTKGVGHVQNGFSISTGMGAVNFDNPAEPRESPFFQIYGAGHEIGHSFGVGHTHNFKIDVNGTPANRSDDVPIDDCARDAGGGAPNCGGVGFGTSSLMSYCLGCPGTIANIRIRYHPEVARCMRDYTAALPNYEDVHSVQDLGGAHAPWPHNPPRLLYAGESPGVDRLTLVGSDNPVAPSANVLFLGAHAAHIVTPDFTLVPSLDIALAAVPPDMPLDIVLPRGFPDGVMLHFQQAFLVQGAVWTSNAIALEVIR